MEMAGVICNQQSDLPDFFSRPLQKRKLTTSLKSSLTPDCCETVLVNRGKPITVTALKMRCLFGLLFSIDL